MLSERNRVDQREHRHGLVARRYLRGEDIRHGHHLVLLLEDYQRVFADNKIVALRIVMGRVERDGIKLLFSKIPGIRRNRALIVAGGSE